MTKPIEPGCLAVVIGDVPYTNNGKFVVVGNFLGFPEDFSEEDGPYWEVDTPLAVVACGDIVKEYANVCAERCLLRIDGENFEHERIADELEELDSKSWK